ncbi:unnamed protein product, partial [Chrysoparadoxa australica]
MQHPWDYSQAAGVNPYIYHPGRPATSSSLALPLALNEAQVAGALGVGAQNIRMMARGSLKMGQDFDPGDLDVTAVRKKNQRRSAAASALGTIASTFDFKYHVGTDPVEELSVLRRVLIREGFIGRLEDLAAALKKEQKDSEDSGYGEKTSLKKALKQRSSSHLAGMLDLLVSIREASVECIEAITRWRQGSTEDPPAAFMWRGENYLLKMRNDLNFLAGLEPLVKALNVSASHLCCNPLMLPNNLEEQKQKMSEGDGQPPQEKQALVLLAQVLIDEEELEERRHSSKGNTHEGNNPDGAAGTTSGEGDSVSLVTEMNVNAELEARERHIDMLQWYQQARDQLVALSINPQDYEFYKHSRRFWRPQELDGGSSQRCPGYTGGKKRTNDWRRCLPRTAAPGSGPRCRSSLMGSVSEAALSGSGPSQATTSGAVRSTKANPMGQGCSRGGGGDSGATWSGNAAARAGAAVHPLALMTEQELRELLELQDPPKAVQLVSAAVCILLGSDPEALPAVLESPWQQSLRAAT